jgi:hypothetical protein
LHQLLASAFADAHVVGVAANWNVLAHAFTCDALGRTRWRLLNDVYKDIFDRFPADAVFPFS